MQTIYNSQTKEVTTKFVLGERQERHGEKVGVLILSITTSKSFNGGEIETSAMASLHHAGFTQHAFGFGGADDNDFRKTLIKTPCKRVTEKVLKACHAGAQVCFQPVLIEALAFYGITCEQYLNQNLTKTA